MPRPKGSKNRKKTLAEQPLEALITQEREKLAALARERESVEAVLAEQNARLKELRAQMKKSEQLLRSYEEEQSKRETIRAAAAAKERLQTRIDELLAQGVSPNELLDKLN